MLACIELYNNVMNYNRMGMRHEVLYFRDGLYLEPTVELHDFDQLNSVLPVTHCPLPFSTLLPDAGQ